MKSVLTILPSLTVGGAENIVCQLIENYDTNRYIGTVLCYGEKTNSYLENKLEKICRVIYVGLKGKIKISSFNKVFKVIKKINPDIIHAHMGGAVFAIAWSWMFSSKVILTVHTAPEKAFSYRIQKIIKHALLKERVYLVAVSKTNYEKAQNYYKCKKNIFLINNGIDTEGYYKELHNKFTFINVARQDENKNQVSIVRAFKKINTQYPNTKLILAGDGPSHKELVDLVSRLDLDKKVDLPGMINNSKEYYAIADVYIQASHREALPLSVLEAMSAGLPILATNVGGLKDVVIDNGYLFEDNEEALLNSMQRIITNTDKLKQMGDKSKEIVCEYTSEKMAEKYMEIYDRMVKE